MEIPTKIAAGFLSLGRVPYTGPYSCPYAPECVEKLFENPQPRANRLAISRIIAT